MHACCVLLCRPVAVLGALGEAGAAELSAAPRAVQEGAFGAFSISAPNPGVPVKLVVGGDSAHE